MNKSVWFVVFFICSLHFLPIHSHELLDKSTKFSDSHSGEEAGQSSQEDPKQPNANNATMYLFHDGFADAWGHFNSSDENSIAEGEYREEKDNGVININLRFRMKPDLNRTVLMDENGEFRGNFKIDVGGDWTNGDNNGPCNNDCENLNITVFKGGSLVWTQQITTIVEGENNVSFQFPVNNDTLSWEGRDDNPIVDVTMKLRGDQQQSGPGGIFLSGEPAYFVIGLGEDSYLDMPISSIDSDGDGVSDDDDLYPDDPEESQDSDGDGVGDNADDFPNDSNETTDSDGDGTGDNSDAFPEDSNESSDTDGDGVGDNSDAFPENANETNDDDGDGVGNNSDAFPQDANETLDTDGDGVGDNADPEPEDPSIRSPEDINVEISDRSAYMISGSVLILAMVILFVRRKAPPQTSHHYSPHVEDDSMWNQ